MDDAIPVTLSQDMHESALWTTQFLRHSHGICMKAHCGRHNSCDRIMKIQYNVDQNILIQHDYQLTCYDRRECLCAARKFFQPAGTLCPLASKWLYNLVAAGKPLACLAASILAARSIIGLYSMGSPIGEAGLIECQRYLWVSVIIFDHWFMSIFSSRILWRLAWYIH